MNEQITTYRQTFMTDSGRRVLAHLLTEAGYFDCDLKTPEEIAVLNFAKKIIKNLGIGNNPDNICQMVNKFFEISIGKEM